ncbi:MAG: AMP-binding enzyme, partial [Pseudomonadota bacterium]
MSLLARFLERAASHPGRTAVIEGSGAAIDYGGLEQRAGQLARTLQRQGIGPGDRVLVSVWPGIALY